MYGGVTSRGELSYTRSFFVGIGGIMSRDNGDVLTTACFEAKAKDIDPHCSSCLICSVSVRITIYIQLIHDWNDE